jgi:hypothetical protein
MLTTISRLWAAFARLAGAVEDLAGTVEATNHGIRSQLGLAAPDSRPSLPIEDETDAATAPETTENGRAKTRTRRGHPPS